MKEVDEFEKLILQFRIVRLEQLKKIHMRIGIPHEAIFSSVQATMNYGNNVLLCLCP
jgi:hypothetical protein